MTVRSPWFLVIAGAIAGMGGAVAWMKRAGADGIPAAPALHYSGTIVENGQPFTGQKSITLSLWTLASGGTRACTQTDFQVTVTSGRFRMSLDDCLAAVHANPDLWVQVEVEGKPFERRKLGAVPYAVEAERASGAAGALARDLVPAGAVMAFDLDSCPPGWAPLATAGGRVIVGAGPGGGGVMARQRGQTFGSESHAVTAEELPPHKHGGTTSRGNTLRYQVLNGAGSHEQVDVVTGFGDETSGTIGTNDQWPLADHTHNFTTNDGPGQSQPIPLAPPSLVLLYCKKG